MGIEQDKPVAGSIIDLPNNLDLLNDLRLPRAFSVWTEFKLKHEPKIAAIGILPLDQIIALGDELSASIGQTIDLEDTTNPRHISEEKMGLLAGAVSGEGNRLIFMRHGEQSSPEWISAIPHPGLRKIRMMQNPFNRTGLLTNGGLVDAFVTALGLLYVQQVTGKNINLLSSENMRAQQVAKIISTVIPGANFSTQEGLNCITYQDDRSEPALTAEQLLAYLPSGAIPWNPKLVDRLCKRTSSGLRQSELIINTVKSLVEVGTEKEDGNNLQIVLTHTQQLAEVLRSRGRLEDPAIRFPELTMFILDGFDVHILLGGILETEEI